MQNVMGESFCHRMGYPLAKQADEAHKFEGMDAAFSELPGGPECELVYALFVQDNK